jgi:tetratricopeptide (TPR) repeat protein
MRRMLIALVAVMGLLSAASSAGAWGHCGWGGYRGCGYGGWGGCYRGGYCGYGGYGGYGGYCGYGGYGGYRPFYSVGYFPAYGGYGYGGYGGYGYGYPYSYGSYGYPYSYNRVGIGYGLPLSIGYSTYRPLGATYNPSANFVVAAAPVARQPVVQQVQQPLKQQVNVNPGPAGVQQFLGIANLRPINVAKPAVPALRIVDQPLARFSNPESRRKAERTMAEGDTLFRAQNFNSALQKYKLAASTAPDLAEIYWREGHALVAVNQFELATTAFKRAIAMTEELSRGGFKLDDLYGGASLTKAAHLESLAEFAMNRRQSADPYFLLGIFLTYDGQQERAQKFFERASDLAGISGGHIAVFLVPTKDVAPVKTAAPAASSAAPVVQVSAGTEV